MVRTANIFFFPYTQKHMGNQNTLSSVCQTTIKLPISAGNSALCAPVDFTFAGACELAFGGPEDPAGLVVCPASTAMAAAACELGVEKAEKAITKGKSYDPDKIAKKVCDDKFR